MEFYQQLNACVLEIESEIPTSVELTDLYTEAKHQLSTVQSLYPALCWFLSIIFNNSFLYVLKH